MPRDQEAVHIVLACPGDSDRASPMSWRYDFPTVAAPTRREWVRNSIILVDFAEGRIREGTPVEQAVVEAGAVRFRPMLLTALAVIVGSAMILFDPIFQGLALSLASGEIASLLISRMAVPVLYAMVRRRHRLESEAFRRLQEPGLREAV